MLKKNNLILGTNIVIIILILIVTFNSVIGTNNHKMPRGNMDEMMDSFITIKSQIQGDMMGGGGYRCCLEKSCTYCIEKTPGHGEGAKCDCLADVINGVHPCGECIGEILEGHGNRYLAKYFATAIAEKTGQKDAIKEIISEKYGISIEEQV